MIITQEYALTYGLPRYFTGEKCKRGHVSERYARNTHCIECAKFLAAARAGKHYRKSERVIRERRARRMQIKLATKAHHKKSDLLSGICDVAKSKGVMLTAGEMLRIYDAQQP